MSSKELHKNPTLSAYDRLACYYRFLFDDWDQAVAAEGERLDRVLRPRGVRRVLDCTCGTGLQCIGLAAKGYEVTGIDGSRSMLREARKNTAKAGVPVRYLLGDIRGIPERLHGGFDAVISCGNSLSHLATTRELRTAFRSMYKVVKGGGCCLVDAWDYESMMREKPHGTYNRTVNEGGRTIILYDTRSYRRSSILADFCIVEETEQGWRGDQFPMKLRAWRKSEVDAAIADAGFVAMENNRAGNLLIWVAIKARIDENAH